jgi:hypothetical protein
MASEQSEDCLELSTTLHVQMSSEALKYILLIRKSTADGLEIERLVLLKQDWTRTLGVAPQVKKIPLFSLFGSCLAFFCTHSKTALNLYSICIYAYIFVDQ